MNYKHESQFKETCSCGAEVEFSETTEFALTTYIQREFEKHHKGCLEATDLLSSESSGEHQTLRKLAQDAPKSNVGDTK